MRPGLLGAPLAWIALCCGLWAPPLRAEPAHPFETPEELLPSVGFWVRVYSEWSSNHVVLHDSTDLSVVYRVLDLSEMAPDSGDSWSVRIRKSETGLQAIRDARDDVEHALRALAERRPSSVTGLTGSLREEYLAWEHVWGDPERFSQAASHV